MNKIIAKDREDLLKIITREINLYGNECSLNHIDTCHITDMSSIFQYSQFNGDISNWNTSNVRDMSYMFFNSQLNSDISGWDVSNVKEMSFMFYGSAFNGDISRWDVSNVEDMFCMFCNQSQFNQDLSNWKPYKADIVEIFKNTDIELPYWANFEDIQERKIAINKYLLNDTLKIDLKEKTHNNTKIKI